MNKPYSPFNNWRRLMSESWRDKYAYYHKFQKWGQHYYPPPLSDCVIDDCDEDCEDPIKLPDHSEPQKGSPVPEGAFPFPGGWLILQERDEASCTFSIYETNVGEQSVGMVIVTRLGRTYYEGPSHLIVRVVDTAAASFDPLIAGRPTEDATEDQDEIPF